MNVMSKMIKAIDQLNCPIVAGIDTTIEMIPDSIKDANLKEFGKTIEAISKMIIDYNKIIIDNICDLVPAVKIQIAMYEMYGISGLIAYEETAKYAKSKDLIVMGDIKRGDIGNTASAYASHLTGIQIEGTHFDTWSEDMITVNPYLGKDSLTPFVDACIDSKKACFVLVKTSNPGSADLQDLIVKIDRDDTKKVEAQGRYIYEVVGEMVSDLGKKYIDETGYNPIGAVVGATHKEIGAKLRKYMPNTFFLVPGYGAQGATAEDLKDFFDKDGRGAIINSSRGIIANWQKDSRFDHTNVGDAAREAVIAMKNDLRNMV